MVISIFVSFFVSIASMASTDSCQSCSGMLNCPQSVKDALESQIAARENAKKANAQAGNASATKNTSGLKRQQLDPMKKAGQAATDCKNIANSCKNTMNKISSQIAAIQSDIEKAMQTLPSCVNRLLNAGDAQSIQSELEYYLDQAKQQKKLTDTEANNCAAAEKNCLGISSQNTKNAEGMGGGKNSASSGEEKASGSGEQGGGGGGGAPPGGAPPQQQPKPEEQQKQPVNCADPANIEAPECRAERCKLPQYVNRQECRGDCSKPENQSHWSCTKKKNPTSSPQ